MRRIDLSKILKTTGYACPIDMDCEKCKEITGYNCLHDDLKLWGDEILSRGIDNCTERTKCHEWQDRQDKNAIKWFDAATSIPLPKQLGIYRYTIEVISDNGDIVCYDYKDKHWKKLVIEDEKVAYVPVNVNRWCNKPTKENE